LTLLIFLFFPPSFHALRASPGTNSKCAICQKTVYAMEFVGVSGKALHKNCFRCGACNCILRTDTYATVNDRFFCQPHYEQMFKRAGNYTSGFAAAGSNVEEEDAVMDVLSTINALSNAATTSTAVPAQSVAPGPASASASSSSQAAKPSSPTKPGSAGETLSLSLSLSLSLCVCVC
jgi:hypothetical protein